MNESTPPLPAERFSVRFKAHGTCTHGPNCRCIHRCDCKRFDGQTVGGDVPMPPVHDGCTCLFELVPESGWPTL